MLGFINLTVEFFIPLLVIVCCYASIIYMLSKRKNHDELSSSQQMNTAANRLQQAKRNTFVTLAIVAGAFVIWWSQTQIIYLMYNLGYSLDFDGTYYNFTVLMVFVNCTINPFIYLVKYRDYQIALKDICSYCMGRRHRGQQDTSTTQSTSVSTTQQTRYQSDQRTTMWIFALGWNKFSANDNTWILIFFIPILFLNHKSQICAV